MSYLLTLRWASRSYFIPNEQELISDHLESFVDPILDHWSSNRGLDIAVVNLNVDASKLETKDSPDGAQLMKPSQFSALNMNDLQKLNTLIGERFPESKFVETEGSDRIVRVRRVKVGNMPVLT